MLRTPTRAGFIYCRFFDPASAFNRFAIFLGQALCPTIILIRLFLSNVFNSRHARPQGAWPGAAFPEENFFT